MTGTTPLARDRRFATYWAGQAISQLGDRVSELALPLIAVTTLHAGAPAVGLLTAAVWAPNLLAVLVGSWVEHRPRKRMLLIASDVARVVVVLSLPAAYWLHAVSLGQLVAVALLTGAAGVVYQTAYPSFFVGLVTREQYVEANSLLSGTRSGSFIAGPALAGGLIQLVGAPVAVLVDAVSFAASAVLIGRVRVEEVPPEAPSAGLLRRAKEGMGFLLEHSYLRASLACATSINFFSFVVAALVILFASRDLHLSPGVIGLAFGLGATGGLLGAVTASSVARRLGTGRTIALGSVLFTAPMALIPLAGGPVWTRAAVLATAELLSAAGVMLFDVNLNALQTAVTPDGMRSRVSGAFTTVNYGIRPLGAVVGGVAGALVGVGPTIVAAAIGGSLSFLWLLRSPIITTRSVADLQPVGAAA